VVLPDLPGKGLCGKEAFLPGTVLVTFAVKSNSLRGN